VTALAAIPTGPANAAGGGNENWSFGSFFGGVGTFFADVDADGAADVIAVGDGPTVVRRSQTNQFNTRRENWTDARFSGNRLTTLADVTGDGRADLIAVNSNSILVRPSEGFRFGDSTDWLGGPFAGERGTFFADVDGDGAADAISVRNSTVIVARSRARLGDNEFGPDEDWTMGPYFGSRTTAFVDVTNDGWADAIVVNNDRVTVRRSTGPVRCPNSPFACFTGNEPWTMNPYFGQRGTFFADMAGGSAADAVVINNSGITVRPSLGDRFDDNVPWTGPFFGNRTTAFADVTGDGKADSIAVNNSGIFVRRTL
jgi:hypothetical protein